MDTKNYSAEILLSKIKIVDKVINKFTVLNTETQQLKNQAEQEWKKAKKAKMILCLGPLALIAIVGGIAHIIAIILDPHHDDYDDYY